MADGSAAFERLKGALRDLAPEVDEDVIVSAALGIHAAMVDLIRDRRGGIAVRRDAGGRLYYAPTRRTPTLSAALARLRRAAAGSPYAWQKAWHEAPRQAIDLLHALAGGALYFAPRVRAPKFAGEIPSPDAAAPFLAAAIRHARGLAGRPPDEPRDRAVIAALRAYKRLTGRYPARPNSEQLRTGTLPILRLLRSIEGAYAEHRLGWGNPIGPGAFKVIRSGRALADLIARAAD